MGNCRFRVRALPVGRKFIIKVDISRRIHILEPAWIRGYAGANYALLSLKEMRESEPFRRFVLARTLRKDDQPPDSLLITLELIKEGITPEVLEFLRVSNEFRRDTFPFVIVDLDKIGSGDWLDEKASKKV